MKKTVIFITACLFSVALLPSKGNSGLMQQRIISLAPATTEILFALGLEERVIGVTAFCNYPKSAQAKEKIGTFSSPDIERIVFLEPDLILATGLEQAPQVARLRRLGLKVYVSDPQNLEELFQSIIEIGRLTAREGRAAELVANLRLRLKKVAERAHKIAGSRTRVFLEVWQDPLITVGKNSFVDELIGIAGGINIAHDLSRPYSYFSAEQVIARDPQCIILGHCAGRGEILAIKRRLGWEGISAIRGDRIYGDIDPDTFLRPGPRIIEGLEALQAHIYPELYR